MTLQGEYVPSPAQWVREQVEIYEGSGGQQANTLRDTGLPVIIVTMRGNKSGKVRKIALMRVAHNGEYALVASKGGAPEHPVWYYNLKANPEATVTIGRDTWHATARTATPRERDEIWAKGLTFYPGWRKYEGRAGSRHIEAFVLSRN